MQFKKSLVTAIWCLAMLSMLASCNFINVTEAKKLFFEKDTPSEDTSTLPGTSSLLSSLRAGYCLNKSESNIFCWGNNFSDHPENIAPLIKTKKIHLKGKIIRDVFAAEYTTCVITTEDLTYCWGEASSVGSTSSNSYIPNPVDMTGVLNGKTTKTISLGQSHGCMIASDDLVYCWGENDKGQLGDGSSVYSSDSPVAVNIAGKTVKSLYSFNDNNCAITSDNNLYCWGDGTYGKLGNNTSVKSHVPVLVAGGDLGGRTIKSFANYNSLMCAIASNDEVYCWGRAQYAGVGVNSLFSSLVPKAVDFTGVLSGKKAKSISLGLNFGCILADDNKVYCWGTNGRDALGDGTTASYSSVPTAVVLGARTAKKLVVSGWTSCIIADDDQVYCWGDGLFGQLGNNLDDTSNTPVAAITSGVLNGKTVKDLYVINDRVCAVANDNLPYCWGRGNLGNNDDSNYYSLVPVALDTSGVLSGKTITKLSMGQSHSCAIGSDQKVYCWGDQNSGQLGNNSRETFNYPVATIDGVSDELIQDGTFMKTYGDSGENAGLCVQRSNGDLYCGVIKSGLSFVHDFGNLTITQMAISRDDSYSCALVDNGDLYCWGNNFSGELGIGTNVNTSVPTKIDMSGVLNGKTIKSVGIGNSTTCVIASDDLAYCWGDGGEHLIGNGSDSNQSSPVAVSTTGVLSGKKIKSLHMDHRTACVIADDDKVYCWGNGEEGQLGNGADASSNEPVAVSTTKKFKTLKNMGSNICGIAEDDYAYCWGYGEDGQLGNGASNSSNIPVAVEMSGVLNGKTIKKLDGNSYSVCVIASDDLPYCFGWGQSGELGNNGLLDSNVPVAVVTSGVLSGKTITEMVVSENSACVVDSNEDVYCWGNGTYYGEIGDGLNAVTSSPVKLVY